QFAETIALTHVTLAQFAQQKTQRQPQHGPVGQFEDVVVPVLIQALLGEISEQKRHGAEQGGENTFTAAILGADKDDDSKEGMQRHGDVAQAVQEQYIEQHQHSQQHQ